MHISLTSRALALVSLAVALTACGAAQPAPVAHDATWSEVRRVPFRTTLPSGSVVALDEAGVVTVDGDVAMTLESDGRLESLEGETIAALLPDGRVSFGGTLTEATIQGGHLVEAGVPVLELDQDRTLTIRRADGQDLAAVPVIGVTPASRDTVLFVLAVHLLIRATETDEAVQELDDEDSGSADVVRLRVPVEGRPARGPESALVTVVMFDDFQCPFCVRAAATMESLRELYGDRVRFVFVHHPLPFHDHAEDAATVAEEAFAQRGSAGFWAMHDVLFANATHLERADLLRYAGQLGLDVARARSALETDRYRARLTEDEALAGLVGVTGTPAFFVNGISIVGAQPLEVFRAQIDEELASAQRLVRAGVPPSRVYAELMEGALLRAPAPPPSAPSAPRRTLDPDAHYRVPVGSAPALGRATALVTIVVFSDFQCPFCSRVLPTLEQVRAQYGDEVRLVFRHNPLPFHQNAMPAAEASLEAFAQGGAAAFWRMHDELFAHQDTLTREDLERFAAEQHLDVPRFRRALDQHIHAATIAADQALATSLGASGTPSFFINGRSLRGAQPFEQFAATIDAELIRARAQLATGTSRRGLYDALITGGATAPAYLPSDGAEEPDEDADRVYAIPVPRGAPVRGTATAPITIQIFSDFQCPFCSRVEPTLEALLAEYSGRIRFVWRNYPLPFHANAEPAAEAALEVLAQLGEAAFWRYHDELFDHQRALERADLETYAAALGGIDMARFRAALDDHRHRPAIAADMQAVSASGAEIGTPSFFIEGRLLQGAQPIEAFRTAIDRALRERRR